MPDGLRIERRGSIELLVLDRPDRGNAVGARLSGALRRAVAAVRRDRALRAVVLTGTGERFFCAGGDLKEYRGLRTRAALNRVFGRTRGLLDALEALPVPVIAAVNGYALGGGAELLLACDVRIAAARARIGFPQARLGLIPGWDGVERLVAACGRATTMRLLLGAEALTAAEAHRVGLIDEVVEDGDVVAAALDVAARLCEAGPLAIRAAKRAVLDAARLPHAAVRRRAATLFTQLWFSDDHREAEQAFVEKRRPLFRGA